MAPIHTDFTGSGFQNTFSKVKLSNESIPTRLANGEAYEHTEQTNNILDTKIIC